LIEDFQFKPITSHDAEEIAGWRYPPPYDIYDMSGSAAGLLTPGYNYRVSHRRDSAVAFLCWGADARVDGFDYDEARVDVGWGLSPEIVGRGNGRVFLRVVIDYITVQTGRSELRVTVAGFNTRCLRACETAGFRRHAEFLRKVDGRKFIVLHR
jgi:RimJ/RimL family protein N-acetyltransferase